MEAGSCFKKGTVKKALTKDLLIIWNSNERPIPLGLGLFPIGLVGCQKLQDETCLAA